MKNTIFYLSVICFLLLAACNNTPQTTKVDTPTQGSIAIAADECFVPIMKEQIDVFTGLYLEASITPFFVNENEAFKLLMNDSVRLIITTRNFTEDEKIKLKAEKNLTLRSQIIALDGIALIVNKENTDTLISTSTLQKIITGEITNWNALSNNKANKAKPIQVVFDNANSSTVRYIKDSICKGKPMSNNLFTANTNSAVIEYVAKNPNAIGVIGVNWISNPTDTNHLTFHNDIKVMYVSRVDNATADTSFQPIPAYLANGNYPLVRNVYAVVSDSKGGLTSGFLSFVAGNSGQRIILKAGLVPATRPTRYINVKTEM